MARANWEALVDHVNELWLKCHQHDQLADQSRQVWEKEKAAARDTLQEVIAYAVAIDALPGDEKKQAKQRLSISASDYSKLLRQGHNRALCSPQNQTSLPASRENRYLLSEASPEALEVAIRDGSVNAEMTRDQVTDWVQAYRNRGNKTPDRPTAAAAPTPLRKAIPYVSAVFDGPATLTDIETLDAAINAFAAAIKNIKNLHLRFPHRDYDAQFAKDWAAWVSKVQKSKRAAVMKLVNVKLSPRDTGRRQGPNQHDYDLPAEPSDDDIKRVLNSLGRDDAFDGIQRDAMQRHAEPKIAARPGYPDLISGAPNVGERPPSGRARRKNPTNNNSVHRAA